MLVVKMQSMSLECQEFGLKITSRETKRKEKKITQRLVAIVLFEDMMKFTH
jgi:hypothetical protein